jgi:FkbM family methyltransferase
MILSIARLLARSYRKLRLLMLGHKKRWTKVAAGLLMYIDPDDPSDQQMLFGAYERPLIRCIERLIHPGEICIDVGAEKGYITLHLARAVGSGGRVLAFEPDLRAAKELRENCVRNGVDSIVTLFQVALADEQGYCDLALTTQLGNSSRFPNEFARAQVVSKISVPTLTLDQVIEGAGISGNVSFIKIDAEGSEPLILKGMSRTIERFRPAIWLEVNRPSLRAGNFPIDAIESPLREAGYDLYRLVGFRDHFLRLKFSLITVRNLAEVPDELFDILAVPRDPVWKARLDALQK